MQKGLIANQDLPNDKGDWFIGSIFNVLSCSLWALAYRSAMLGMSDKSKASSSRASISCLWSFDISVGRG